MKAKITNTFINLVSPKCNTKQEKVPIVLNANMLIRESQAILLFIVQPLNIFSILLGEDIYIIFILFVSHKFF